MTKQMAVALFVILGTVSCGSPEELPRPANEAQLRALFEPPKLPDVQLPPSDAPRCGPELDVTLKPKRADVAVTFHLPAPATDDCHGVVAVKVALDVPIVEAVDSPVGWASGAVVTVEGEWVVRWHAAHPVVQDRIDGFVIHTSRRPRLSWWEARLDDGVVMGFAVVEGVP